MIDCIINHDCKTSSGLISENGSCGWFIHQLEVPICFWSSAAWPTPNIVEPTMLAVVCIANNVGLQGIMGRIQPIRLCKPCVICVRGCWRSCATESNIVAPRFGDHRTKEMFEIPCSKVWPVSNFAQQLRAIRNKMQKECKWTQHETSINVGSFCTGLKMKRWIYEFQIFGLRDEEITIITFFASISLSRGLNMWTNSYCFSTQKKIA